MLENQQKQQDGKKIGNVKTEFWKIFFLNSIAFGPT
jgi:hypothetical protein